MRNAAAIGVSCFLAYAGCYMGKNILSSMLPQMIGSGVYSRDSLAAMGSAFFVTYGTGQLVNGFVGDRVSAKYMVSAGLLASGLLCAAFPLLSSEALSLVLWGICGFLCSMLWGPISKMVGENTSRKVGTVLLTLLTVASIAGTAATYLLAVQSALRADWKFGFFATGAALTGLAVFWFFADHAMERKGIVRAMVPHGKKPAAGKTGAALAGGGFAAMALAAMLNGVIRNAVVFWIPTFISERFSVSAAAAAGITSILPFVNLGGTLFSVRLAEWTHNDEKKALTVFFVFTTLMFCLMILLGNRRMALSVAALFCASAAMTGASNLIFTHYVLRFAGTGKISSVTGFLDFSSYVAASAASFLFSSLVPSRGWDFVVGTWAAVAAAGAAAAWCADRIARRSPAVRSPG